MRFWRQGLALGSSPRVRGEAKVSGSRVMSIRIIPACAGKRRDVEVKAAAVGDHPRVCGEKAYVAYRSTNASGSSPRVRGKERRNSRQIISKRIIPACAGKSQSQQGYLGQLRIIPACAGKSWSPHCFSQSSWDHPRVCGEKPSGDLRPSGVRGSSPRVRGKVVGNGLVKGLERIIPACAGKRACAPAGAPCGRDHPRVCGEKGSAASSIHATAGSSPRVRGKGQRLLVRRRVLGIIPACAGKSSSAMGLMNAYRDHPRVCGEKLCRRRQDAEDTGSSPRVRGKDLEETGTKVQTGIIPACAGKRTKA